MSKTKKVAKPKVNDRHVMRLYLAIANYVEKNGGKVAVVGGIQVQEWEPRSNKFIIAVKCTGIKPKFGAD